MRILLVEDNKGDQVIMGEAFEDAKVQCDLVIVSDGVEALRYLKKGGEYNADHLPNLIILDLNLPKQNGSEVLAQIKKDPKLQHIPVVVLSNSQSPKDICQCYALRANAYVGKPSGFQGFVDFAHTIRLFWIGLVCYCDHS